MSTLYEILGVETTASAEEIKAAYRRKVKETHPDAGGEQEEFRRVQHAYEVLGDDGRRAAYDRDGEDREGERLAPTPTAILVEAFRVALDALSRHPGASPIELTRIALRERIKAERRHQSDHALEARRWREILEKIERKAGAEAILEHVLQQAIAPHTRRFAEAQAWIEGCELALKLLDGYRYRDGADEFFELADVLAGLSEDRDGNGRRPARKRRAKSL